MVMVVDAKEAAGVVLSCLGNLLASWQNLQKEESGGGHFVPKLLEN